MKNIILKPIITEKSMSQVSKGRYVFQVLKNANKVQIAQEIADLYKVEVLKVNIINIKGEKKLVKGRFLAKTKQLKKAIVTLKKGQKIAGFEEK